MKVMYSEIEASADPKIVESIMPMSDEEMEKVSGGKRSIQVGADNGASFRIVLGLATAQEN